MGFSATASLTASVMLGVVGIATLRHVRELQALLFAFTRLQALVSLSLEVRLGRYAVDHSAFLFSLYAIAILPPLLPTAVARLLSSHQRDERGATPICLVLVTGIDRFSGIPDLIHKIKLPLHSAL